MLKKVIKYFFIILICLTIFGAWYIKKKKEENPPTIQEKIIEQSKKEEVEEDIVKEIRIGIPEFDNINPLISHNKYIQEVSRIIFEPLLEVDENYKIKKCLAKDWAKVNYNTYLVKIRDDIKWSDGNSFTTDDVIFTVNILKQIQSVYTSNVQNIISISKSEDDPNTVQIILDREIPFFEYNLIFPIMSYKSYEGQDFLNTDRNIKPVTTGKYLVSENNSQFIELKKNTNYNREELTLDTVRLVKYATIGELYNSFKLGKLDIMTTNNIFVDDYIGKIGYNRKELAGREFDFIALNTQNNVLKFREVRDCLSHAINRENIVSSVYNNKYKVMDYPLDYGNWLKGEKTDNSYNPDLAKKILQDSGWEYKYDKWQIKDNYVTRYLNFKIVVQQSSPERTKIAEMIKQDLENIGIRVNIIVANEKQYDNYLQNGNYDAIIIGLTSSLSPNIETYFGDYNYAKFQNAEMQSLIHEVRDITNEDLLKEKYERIRQIFNYEKPYIGLYSNYYNISNCWALKGNVSANWYNIFIDIKDWYKN